MIRIDNQHTPNLIYYNNFNLIIRNYKPIEKEKKFIYCKYGCGQEGKYQLQNGTGCCSSHYTKCPAQRKKIGLANKGKKRPPRSEEYKRKMSEALKGKKRSSPSEEHKRKISEANTGKVRSEEAKRKISEALKGKTHSEERKRKNSERQKGRKHSEETKRKMSCRIVSEETRKKLSCTHQGISIEEWDGFIACEPYCDVWVDNEFKESIKERDGYKCLNPDCWKNCDHLPLCIMHINNIKKDCHPSNLITGCISCNTRAMKDRKWWTSWYRAIMHRRYGYIY